MDYDIIVSEFEFQFIVDIHFWTNAHWESYEPFYLPSNGLNSVPTVLFER